MNKKQSFQIAACLFPLDNTGQEVQLFPAGKFSAPEGALQGTGPWVLNQDNAQKLIAAVNENPHLLIDYDHQSLLFTKNQQPLETAGTFSGAKLQWREGKGLFATDVQWTDTAAANIKQGKHKYISPLFTYDSQTGAVQRLISMAVTDNPAIKNMQAIELAAASFLTLPKEKTMNKDLLILLGLAEDATEQDALAACTALKADADFKAKAAQLIGADKKAQADEVLAALSKLKDDFIALAAASTQAPDSSKYVPIAVVSELQEQLAALSKGVETDKVEQLIAANATKLPTAGLKEWAKTQTLAALSAYLEKAPEVAALSGLQSDGKNLDDKHQDSLTIAAAAQKYQFEQHQAGREISVADAVSHVTHGAN